MVIKKNVSAWELKNELWSGALDTLEVITESCKLDELLELLEEIYSEGADITTVNDLLWFEPEYIYEMLDIAADE